MQTGLDRGFLTGLDGPLQRRGLPDDKGLGFLGFEGLLEGGFLDGFTHARLLV
jgi:hypothetical protein